MVHLVVLVVVRVGFEGSIGSWYLSVQKGCCSRGFHLGSKRVLDLLGSVLT